MDYKIFSFFLPIISIQGIIVHKKPSVHERKLTQS